MTMPIPPELRLQVLALLRGLPPELPQELFVPGEVIDAQVVQAVDTANVVIVVKGIPIEASSQVGQLKVGQVIRARVESVDGKILLHLEDPTLDPAGSSIGTARTADPIVRALRALLPANEPLQAGLERLRLTLDAALKTGEVPKQTAEVFASLLQRVVLTKRDVTGERVHDAGVATGLQHEHELLVHVQQKGTLARPAQVPSLKSWLLAVVAEQEEARAPQSALARPESEVPWVKEATQLLKVIERMQVVNTLNAQHGQPLFFELPIGETTVRLYVDPERQREAEAEAPDQLRTCRLVTLQDLEGMGAIRVDAMLTGRRIAARIQTEHAEVERSIARSLPSLQEGLAAHGYQVDTLAVSTGSAEVVRGHELVPQGVPQRQLLNVLA